nr:ulp1 protease family, C-terminal catalytic domain-containing protein [Tanacetum cinerariifolium]
MEDGSMIKITRELIYDMLGIPMDDIKVKSLKEKNLLDPFTAKWRGMVSKIVNHENKIPILQLETFVCTLSEVDWLFDIRFLSLLFSIFGQGNKNGTINERLIQYLDETYKIYQMDWYSYVLESLVKECTRFSASDKFSGPLLLLALIYVNSTLSKKVKVEKTVPTFKVWSSNLLLKRKQEELDLKGFGFLPIVKERARNYESDGPRYCSGFGYEVEVRVRGKSFEGLLRMFVWCLGRLGHPNQRMIILEWHVAVVDWRIQLLSTGST